MFARYFVELPVSWSVAGAVLGRDPETWLPGLVDRAQGRGSDLLASVGFGSRVRLAHNVSVNVGQCVQMDGRVILPMHWRAEGAAGLFPQVDAQIDVAPLGPEGSQLAINARYDPPFSALGRAADRAALHRVAEAVIKDFLDQVAEAMMTEARDAGSRETLG